jgi:hypothetical protein
MADDAARGCAIVVVVVVVVVAGMDGVVVAAAAVSAAGAFSRSIETTTPFVTGEKSQDEPMASSSVLGRDEADVNTCFSISTHA